MLGSSRKYASVDDIQGIYLKVCLFTDLCFVSVEQRFLISNYNSLLPAKRKKKKDNPSWIMRRRPDSILADSRLNVTLLIDGVECRQLLFCSAGYCMTL